MSRPVKARTADTYQREIQALLRLRSAIVLDSGADKTIADRAIEHIDALVKDVIALKDRASGPLEKAM